MFPDRQLPRKRLHALADGLQRRRICAISGRMQKTEKEEPLWQNTL